MKRDIGALIAFIDSRQNSPWQWGANDCVSFALAAAEAQTGHLARAITWRSVKGAMRALKKFGTLEAAFDAHFERIPAAHARRGEIALAPSQPIRGDVLATASDGPFAVHSMIVEGVTLVGPGKDGNRRLPRSCMICAWSIERPKA